MALFSQALGQISRYFNSSSLSGVKFALLFPLLAFCLSLPQTAAALENNTARTLSLSLHFQPTNHYPYLQKAGFLQISSPFASNQSTKMLELLFAENGSILSFLDLPLQPNTKRTGRFALYVSYAEPKKYQQFTGFFKFASTKPKLFENTFNSHNLSLSVLASHFNLVGAASILYPQNCDNGQLVLSLLHKKRSFDFDSKQLQLKSKRQLTLRSSNPFASQLSGKGAASARAFAYLAFIAHSKRVSAQLVGPFAFMYIGSKKFIAHVNLVNFNNSDNLSLGRDALF